MASLFRAYVRLVNTHPWKTQCLTTGCLMCLGDGLAQTLVERKSFQQFDVNRSTRFFLFGTFVAGPTLRSWYIILDKVTRGPAKIAAVQKMALDQLLFAPAFIGFFLTSMTFWATGSKQTAIDKCKKDYVEVVLANWKLWPAAQILNFYFIPLNWRLMYVNVIAVFWNTYLAYMSERDTQSDTEEPSNH